MVLAIVFLMGKRRAMGGARGICNVRVMGKKQAMAFLDGLEAKGIMLGLGRIEKFLAFIGNPEKRFMSVHVAGTNGKGSTCAMVERVLREAGFKTGFYSSPHLVHFNERIKVNGNSIGDARLAGLVAETRRMAEKSGIELSYFEFVTAMAFRHFAASKVEVAVVEAGMGGRLDATNVLVPLVSVVTNIELEHEAYLGNSLGKIAAEKAGIIKKGVPVVTGERRESVLRVVRERCRGQNARLVVAKRPYAGKIGLLGAFQEWNAALAFEVALQLQKQGVVIKDGAVKKGIAKAEWPGRFQIVRRRPVVVLDCAHNPACCAALAEAFAKIFPGKKALLVFGVSSDKQVNGMAVSLAGVSKKVFATNAKLRAMPFEIIEKAFSGLGVELKRVAGVSNALKKALSEAGKGDIVLVSGSCFVVGEAMAALGKKGN